MSQPFRRFVEGDLCFDFDEGWTHIIPWDKHAAYKNGIRKVNRARAVDFIGIYRNRTMFFIEVKDYRTHRAPHGRDKHEDPWVELELKVRHSVAGLVGAHRQGCYDEACSPIVTALVDRCELKLVYWLDEAFHSHILKTTEEQRRRAGAGFHMQKLKTYLPWLDARVWEASSADYKRVLPGVEVVSLPQDLQARANLVVAMLAQRRIVVPTTTQQRLNTWVRNNDRTQIDQCLCRVPFVSDARQLIKQRG